MQEHAPTPLAPAKNSGSSPRSWGTRPTEEDLSAATRFIPTLVGNTRACCRLPRMAAVHPHARGEHHPRIIKQRAVRGSSPRSWGTLRLSDLRRISSRFIPTLVGNTIHAGNIWRQASVHPHARGEHFHQAHVNKPLAGSSPRSWGTRPPDDIHKICKRFIPTLVGNTSSGSGSPEKGAVHPHARGEHLTK